MKDWTTRPSCEMGVGAAPDTLPPDGCGAEVEGSRMEERSGSSSTGSTLK
jgi:hypothetical protein